MQFPAVLNALDDHACQLAHLALRIFLYHLLQLLHTPVAVAIVQHAQSVDKQELIPVGTLWESCGRKFSVLLHHISLISLEGIVGSSIERIFYLLAETGVLCIIWVGYQHSPLTFGKVFLHVIETC